jgi:hypothetical protein
LGKLITIGFKVGWYFLVLLVVLSVSSGAVSNADRIVNRVREVWSALTTPDSLADAQNIPSHVDGDWSGQVDGSETTSAAWSLDNAMQSLGCSQKRGFDVAVPATAGYTCRSEGDADRPFTVFEYRSGWTQETLDYRLARACAKAREHGRGEVFAMAQRDAFVYTLSPEAVSLSGLASSFDTLDATSCVARNRS